MPTLTRRASEGERFTALSHEEDRWSVRPRWRVGLVWAGVIPSASMVLSLLGCGPGIVDPGRSVRVAPPSSVPPAAPAGLPTLGAPEIQQVPSESVLQFPVEPESSTYHAVQPGETLTSVSKKYGVRVEQLRSSNGLDDSTPLQAKQLLFIPKGR